MAEKVKVEIELNPDDPTDFDIYMKGNKGNKKEGKEKEEEEAKPKKLSGRLTVSNPTICYYQGGVLRCISW